MAIWVTPELFLFVAGSALLLVATVAWPYLPMGTGWQKAAIAAAMAMLFGLIGPVALWLLYILTLGQARAVAIGLAGAATLAFFGYLKRRQRRRQQLGAWH